MAKEKKISWFGLFVKIILIFVTILILMWLVSKIINRNRLSDTFKNSINSMEEGSVNYFKKTDLPTKKGDSKKVTLEELQKDGTVKEVTGKNKSTCDVKKSYSKITRKKENYLVETYLICGKESNKITRKFDIKDCKNCNSNTDNSTDNNKDNNSTNSENNEIEKNNTTNKDNTTSDNTTNVTTTYYEYVKETTSYSNWMTGDKTGSNIENKYEYYSIANKEYYSVGIIEENSIKNNEVEYTLKLNKVPNKDYYYTKITSSDYFNSSDFNSYVNESSISMNNGRKLNLNGKQNSMLKDDNFTYTLIPYYNKGDFYVKVKINIISFSNINKYYDETTKNNVYLIPIKMNILFDNGKVSSIKPSGEYETISYYRYVEVNRETKWSTEDYLEGYIKTGNTKVQ